MLPFPYSATGPPSPMFCQCMHVATGPSSSLFCQFMLVVLLHHKTTTFVLCECHGSIPSTGGETRHPLPLGVVLSSGSQFLYFMQTRGPSLSRSNMTCPILSNHLSSFINDVAEYLHYSNQTSKPPTKTAHYIYAV